MYEVGVSGQRGRHIERRMKEDKYICSGFLICEEPCVHGFPHTHVDGSCDMMCHGRLDRQAIRSPGPPIPLGKFYCIKMGDEKDETCKNQ